MISPELQTQLSIWRAQAAEGTISLDDMRKAIIALRAGRMAAQAANVSSGKKTKAPARSVDDLLGELGSL